MTFRHRVGIYNTPHSRTTWLTVTTGVSHIVAVPVPTAEGDYTQSRLTELLQAGDGLAHMREGAGESGDNGEAPASVMMDEGRRSDDANTEDIQDGWMDSNVLGLSDDEDDQDSTGAKDRSASAAPLEMATTPSLRMTQIWPGVIETLRLPGFQLYTEKLEELLRQPLECFRPADIEEDSELTRRLKALRDEDTRPQLTIDNLRRLTLMVLERFRETEQSSRTGNLRIRKAPEWPG